MRCEASIEASNATRTLDGDLRCFAFHHFVTLNANLKRGVENDRMTGDHAIKGMPDRG